MPQVDSEDPNTAVAPRKRWKIAFGVAAVAIVVAGGTTGGVAIANAQAAEQERIALEQAEFAAAREAFRDARAEAQPVANNVKLSLEAGADLGVDTETLDEALDAFRPLAYAGVDPASTASQLDTQTDALIAAQAATEEAFAAYLAALMEALTSDVDALSLASSSTTNAASEAIEAIGVDGAADAAPLIEAALDALAKAKKSHDDEKARRAAEEAAASSGGGSSGGGSSNGGYTGGGSSSGGSSSGGGSTPYTDAQAIAAVQSTYGDATHGVYGSCLAINYGTWGRTSTPPPPNRSKIDPGGSLHFTAYSTGEGGSVQYYACY